MLTNKVPYPANDGSSIAMASMVDGFLKNGTDLTLLSLNTKKHFKPESSIAEELPEKLPFYFVDVDTDVKPIGAAINLVSGAPYHVSRFYQKGFAAKLEELLQHNDFDIVQVEGLSMMVYYDQIRAQSKAKITYRAHNVEYQIWQRHIENNADFFQKAYLRIQVKRLKRFEIEALEKADAVIAITAEDEENIQRLNPLVESTSIPCGIALEKKNPCAVKEYQSDLGYLASFDWMPNVQGVLWFVEKVWPILKKKSPNITFHLGGRHMPASFQKLKGKGISLFPDVPDMAEFVCQSKVQIIPLLAGSGMRIKIIENMALGKCQVSTSVGAEGIMVRDGSDILIGDTPKDFAKAVLKVLNSDELRASVEQKSRETIERYYDNAALGKKLLNFYTQQLC